MTKKRMRHMDETIFHEDNSIQVTQTIQAWLRQLVLKAGAKWGGELNPRRTA
jgi:uncharacterized protein involved in type VI secretion and phage assembly